MSSKTRKLIWSAPLVAVLAVAATLAIFAAQPPGVALAHDPPGVVGNLTGEADGTNAIDLSWDAPTMGGTPTSYRIDRSMNGNTWMTHVTGHTMRTYSDMKLKPGMSYYYRVFAVNAAGTGPVSQDYQVQTDSATAPGGIVELSAKAMGQNQINLMWTAPAKLGGSPITKYSIHFAMGEDAIPDQGEMATNDGVMDVDADDGTSYEHKKLTAGTRYRYVVYAYNAIDKSMMASNTVAASTASLDRPGAPSGVTAVQTGERQFTLYWYAPTSTGGAPITGYRVQVAYNNFGYVLPTTDLTVNPVSGTADNNTPTAQATFTVPGDFDHDADGNTDAVDITRVRFRVYSQTGDHDVDPVTGLESSSGATTSRSMTFLPEESTPADKTAGDRANLIPAAVDGSDIDAMRDPFKNVDLAWESPPTDSDNTAPDSIGGYRIDVSDNGFAWRALIRHTGKTAPEYQYVDDVSKSRYYRIFAWHAQYLGPAQTSIAQSALETGTPTAPGHVTSFTATAVGPTQINLAWTAPENNGGAPIVRYRVDAVRQADGTFAAFPLGTSGQVVTAGTSSDGVLYATSKTGSYSHEKLKAGETWKYRVLTVTDDESQADNIRTSDSRSDETRTATTHQAALPEAPEGLVAEDAKDSSQTGTVDRGVLLLWNAPNPPDGAAIDGYRVQRKKGDADWETLEMDTGNVFTDYTDVSEPEAGEVRQYKVAALNGSKLGAYSMVAYYPHELTMHNMAPMPEGTIAAMTVMAGKMSTPMNVSMYFSDADMDDTLTYTAMSSMKKYATVEIGGDDMNMLTITGVAEGTATITVTATDMDDAMVTQTFMVTVEAAASMELGMASNLSIGINSGGTIQVSWDAADNAVGYIVIAIDRSDFSAKSAPVNPDSAGVTQTTLNLGDLTVGNDYYVYVAATGSAGANTLSVPPLEVTAQ